MANNPPPKKQGAKNQGPKNQGPKNQGAKNQGPKNQGPKNQGPKNQGPKNQGATTQILRDLGPKNQGGKKQPPKKQGGKKQGGKKQNNNNNRNPIQDQQNATGGTTVTRDNGITVVDTPNTAPSVESLIAQQQQAFAREALNKAQETELAIAQGDNQTRVTLGSQNLQGVQAQADATKFSATEAAEAQKFSSVQAAEAQKFAATEQARGSIETQRVASESEERQIGLRGTEERETNLQSELFRRFKEAKDQLDALKAFKA
jgi:hypothetical protein